jgi:hypothetical protein
MTGQQAAVRDLTAATRTVTTASPQSNLIVRHLPPTGPERVELEVSLREMKRGWFIHAAVYAVVNVGLMVLNLVLVAKTEDNFLWLFFPLVAGGSGSPCITWG